MELFLSCVFSNYVHFFFSKTSREKCTVSNCRFNRYIYKAFTGFVNAIIFERPPKRQNTQTSPQGKLTQLPVLSSRNFMNIHVSDRNIKRQKQQTASL